MARNVLRKKCPRCGRMRKFVPSESGYASGRRWQLRGSRLVCYWCVARETPAGEEELRVEQARLRAETRTYKHARRLETKK